MVRFSCFNKFRVFVYLRLELGLELELVLVLELEPVPAPVPELLVGCPYLVEQRIVFGLAVIAELTVVVEWLAAEVMLMIFSYRPIEEYVIVEIDSFEFVLVIVELSVLIVFFLIQRYGAAVNRFKTNYFIHYGSY